MRHTAACFSSSHFCAPERIYLALLQLLSFFTIPYLPSLENPHDHRNKVRSTGGKRGATSCLKRSSIILRKTRRNALAWTIAPICLSRASDGRRCQTHRPCFWTGKMAATKMSVAILTDSGRFADVSRMWEPPTSSVELLSAFRRRHSKNWTCSPLGRIYQDT